MKQNKNSKNVNTVELKILNESKLIGEIDLIKFMNFLKNDLDILKAVFKSTTILYDDLNWEFDYVVRLLCSELEWSVILMNLKYRLKNENQIKFKVCPIEYKNKIEYKKYAKNATHSHIALEEIKTDGKGLILINSFNSTPDHIIDVWLSKSVYPYPETEWKGIILD